MQRQHGTSTKIKKGIAKMGSPDQKGLESVEGDPIGEDNSSDDRKPSPVEARRISKSATTNPPQDPSDASIQQQTEAKETHREQHGGFSPSKSQHSQGCCDSVSTGQHNEALEKKRQMNIIYSRRKREKKKIQIESLHARIRELYNRKRFLLREGAKLELLLKHAIAIINHLNADSSFQESATLGNPNMFRTPAWNPVLSPVEHASLRATTVAQRTDASVQNPISLSLLPFLTGTVSSPATQPPITAEIDLSNIQYQALLTLTNAIQASTVNTEEHALMRQLVMQDEHSKQKALLELAAQQIVQKQQVESLLRQEILSRVGRSSLPVPTAQSLLLQEVLSRTRQASTTSSAAASVPTANIPTTNLAPRMSRQESSDRRDDPFINLLLLHVLNSQQNQQASLPKDPPK